MKFLKKLFKTQELPEVKSKISAEDRDFLNSVLASNIELEDPTLGTKRGAVQTMMMLQQAAYIQGEFTFILVRSMEGSKNSIYFEV